ncbi:hypothetical protein [Chamaesiphon sp. VAR_48_metabat_135_sub]|uniref:hypothetical protein n=1 Tax=Chamaesiphon sp. VAR_48_metabat_135_sub TaxID=2964699 RepID=UPI00286CB503|nr:hypothetical protein [Chamaesiphon sp. VAR_48_metabat_135_sub]
MDISIERAIATYFSQWLAAHAYLAWIISHPLPSFGLFLLTIFSLWGLIKAVGRGIEQIWLFLLTTPFKLLLVIFRPIWSSIRRIFGHNNFSDEQQRSLVMPNTAPEQIDRIIDRLHRLNQEQEILLRELSALADPASVRSAEGIVSDTQYRDLSAKLPKFN